MGNTQCEYDYCLQVALVSPQNTTNWSSAHHTGDAASEQTVYGWGTTSSLRLPSSISNVYILCLLVTLVKETSQLRLKGFNYTKSYTILYFIIVKLILYIFYSPWPFFAFVSFTQVTCLPPKNLIPPESTGWVEDHSIHPDLLICLRRKWIIHCCHVSKVGYGAAGAGQLDWVVHLDWVCQNLALLQSDVFVVYQRIACLKLPEYQHIWW